MTRQHAGSGRVSDSPGLTRYGRWAGVPLDDVPVISVIIPTYNEQWRIIPTIGAVALEISSRGEPWELIVSDDGSTDDTRQLVRGLGLANLRLIESDNTGKGGAVRRGVLAARGRYVLFVDADQSTPIEQFDRLLTHITEQGADVVVGSRAAEGATESSRSRVRRALSAGLRAITRRGFGITVSDTQCGFKLFTREAAGGLFAMQRLNGFSFDLELLFLATHLGLKVVEEPVEWIDAPGSKVDPVRVALRFAADLARVRWWAARGAYATASPADRPPLQRGAAPAVGGHPGRLVDQEVSP